METEKIIIGYCAVSGEPIYEDEARIEESGKLYKPEYYVPEVKKSLFDKILGR